MGTNFVPMASPLTNQTQSGSNTGIPPCSTNSVLSGAQPIALSYPTTGRDNAFTPFAQKLLERSGLARLIVLSGLVVGSGVPYWYVSLNGTLMLRSPIKYGNVGIISPCGEPSNWQKIPALEYLVNQKYFYLLPNDQNGQSIAS